MLARNGNRQFAVSTQFYGGLTLCQSLNFLTFLLIFCEGCYASELVCTGSQPWLFVQLWGHIYLNAELFLRWVLLPTDTNKGEDPISFSQISVRANDQVSQLKAII